MRGERQVSAPSRVRTVKLTEARLKMMKWVRRLEKGAERELQKENWRELRESAAHAGRRDG